MSFYNLWNLGTPADINEWTNDWKVDHWLWWLSIASRGDPVREHGGGSLTGDSEGKIERDIYWEVKMPSKRLFLSLVAPLGNLEGIRLLGLFEGKG